MGFSLPASLIPAKETIFTLNVSGESMINVGIYDGDIVIVQQGSMVDDHEASTSKAKPRDSKHIQPKWCPPGLTKIMKRPA